MDDISEVNMDYGMTVYFMQTWNDPRLKLDPDGKYGPPGWLDNCSISLATSIENDIWVNTVCNCCLLIELDLDARCLFCQWKNKLQAYGDDAECHVSAASSWTSSLLCSYNNASVVFDGVVALPFG